MTPETKSVGSFAKIPAGWDVVPLPEVAFFQEGPGLRKWQWADSGMKVINVTNILPDGQIDTANTSRFISMEEFTEKYSHFAVVDGDIVIASSGNTYGKIGRISAKDLPVMMNTSVIRFHSSNDERLDDDFLYAFLRSEMFRTQIESFVIGSAQPNFGPSHLKQMFLPLPPLPIQRRIASILSAYDELIENNRRRIRILEEMARSIYREWFVDFRFPGHEKIPLVDSSLGPIPQGWGVNGLPECVEINPRVVVPKGHEFPFVPMGSLANDSMLITDTEMRLGNGGAKFRNGDTLFARITPCLENGKTGFVQFLADEQAMACGSTEFIVLRSKTLTPEFVYCLARNEEFRGNAIKSKSGASGRQRVQENCFGQFLVVHPTQIILDRFSSVAVPSFRLVHQLHLQNQNLRRTRDLLLPRLLLGTMNISDAADPTLLGGETETLDDLVSETKEPSGTAILVSKESPLRQKALSAASTGMSPDRLGHKDRGDQSELGYEIPPAIDQTDRLDVLAAIRQVFSDGQPRNRENAVRDVARALGYGRVGNRIQDVLHTDLLTAVRRGILENAGGELRLLVCSIADYDKNLLKQQFLAAIGRSWIGRDEAIQNFCRWMGFRRTGPIIDETARSLINGLLRENRIEADGPNLIRRSSYSTEKD
jgi:type I restriction enzyme, S subunit